MLEIGLKGQQSETVTNDKTAAEMGSGTLPVYATPAMIALMEKTAMLSVSEELGENEATVGTNLEIAHLAACGLGTEITCTSELIEIDRRRLVFTVKVFDDKELLGEGIHERFIVDNAKFIARLDEKKKSLGIL